MQAQQTYPTIEQELLAIVELLKEFRDMLYGQRLKIYTNNKNFTSKFLNCSINTLKRGDYIQLKFFFGFCRKNILSANI
mgnify:CR=1 FL=1